MTNTLHRNFGIAAIAALVVAVVFSLPLLAHANEGKDSFNITPPKAAVAITDTGTVLVRGAKVTAVSGSSITAQVLFGAVTMNWNIATDGNTAFYNARGGSATLSAITIGDTVSFAGTLDGSANVSNVKAKAVKDWTPVAATVTISGTVSSINSSGLSLVLQKGNDHNTPKTVTVQFTTGTTVTLNGAASSFAALQAQDGLKVTGTLSADNTTLSATNVTATRPATIEDKKFLKDIKLWFSNKANFDFHLR